MSALGSPQHLTGKEKIRLLEPPLQLPAHCAHPGQLISRDCARISSWPRTPSRAVKRRVQYHERRFSRQCTVGESRLRN